MAVKPFLQGGTILGVVGYCSPRIIETAGEPIFVWRRRLRRDQKVRRIGGAKPGANHPWKRGFPQQGDKITEQLE